MALVIDDEKFTFLEALQKHKFAIDYKPDLQTINELEPYEIVLCDIRGVGKFLASKFEGAHLIREAKKFYPSKQIIAFTASAFDASYKDYFDVADDYVRKDTSLDVWIALLDERVKKCVDPIHQWHILRESLLKAGMETIDVARIEKLYVDAVKKKDFNAFENLVRTKVKLSSNVLDVVTKFMASLAVKLMTKAFTGGVA